MMKMRMTFLAVLPVFSLSLLSCTAPPPVALAANPAVTATTPSSVGPARFPHEKHFTELEIECAQCHHETNAKPLSIPHPEYFVDSGIDCATCHRAKGEPALDPQACSVCHHTEREALGDETLSAKVVIHKKCWSCHEVGTGAAASASCKGCHTPGS